MDEDQIIRDTKEFEKKAFDEINELISNFGPNEYVSHVLNKLEYSDFDSRIQSWKEFKEQSNTFFDHKEIPFYYKRILKKYEKDYNKEPTLRDFFSLYNKCAQCNIKNCIRNVYGSIIDGKKKSEVYNQLMQMSIESQISEEFLERNKENSFLNKNEFSLYVNNMIVHMLADAPISIFISKIQSIPLFSKHEVISRAIDLIWEDRNNHQKDSSSNSSHQELARLSSILGICFDIQSYDGEKFYYECDTKFQELFNENLNIESPLIQDYQDENVDGLDKAYKSSDGSAIASSRQYIREYFSLLLSGEINTVSSHFRQSLIPSTISHGLSNELIRIIRLRFVRNRSLFQNILRSINFLSNQEKELVIPGINELESIVLTYIFVCYSNECHKLDYDLLIEKALELCNQYYEAKVKIMEILSTIQKYLTTPLIMAIKQEIFNKQPEFMINDVLDVFSSFRISITSLDLLGTIMYTITHSIILRNQKISCYYNRTIKYELIPSINKVLGLILNIDRLVCEIAFSFAITDKYYLQYVKLSLIESINKEYLKMICMFLSIDFIDKNTFDNRPENQIFLFSDMPYSYSEYSLFFDSLSFEEKKNLVFILPKYFYYFQKIKKLLIKLSYAVNIYQKYMAMDIDSVFSGLFESNQYLDLKSLIFDYERLKTNYFRIRSVYHLLTTFFRYNSFKIDSVFIINYLSNNDSDLFLTKQDPSFDKNFLLSKPYILRMMIIHEPENFDSFPYLEIFEYLEKIKKDVCLNIIVPYMIKIEIALLSLHERTFLSDFSQSEFFDLSEKKCSSIYDESNLLVLNCFPKLISCLGLPNNILILEKIIDIISYRLNLMYIIKLKQTLAKPLSKIKDITKKKMYTWESPIFQLIFTQTPRIMVSQSDSNYNPFRDNFCFYHQLLKASIVTCFDESMIKWNHSRNRQYYLSALDGLNQPLRDDKCITLERYVSSTIPNMFTEFSDEIRNSIGEVILRAEKVFQQTYGNIICLESKIHLLSYSRSCIKKILFLNASKSYHDNLSIMPILYSTDRFTYENNEGVALSNIGFLASNDMSMLTVLSSFSFNHVKKLEDSLDENINSEILRYFCNIFKQDLDSYQQSFSSVFSIVNSLFKPEQFSSRKRISILQKSFSPIPNESDRQFNQEYRYLFARILQRIIDEIHKSRTQNGIIQLNSLIAGFQSLSIKLETFIGSSRMCLFRTWPSYLENVISIYLKQQESSDILSVYMNKYLSRRDGDLLNVDYADRFFSKILLMNSLNLIQKQKLKEQSRMTAVYEVIVRKEYDTLLRDLINSIEKQRKLFSKVHSSLYNTVFRTISRVTESSNELDSELKPKGYLQRTLFPQLFKSKSVSVFDLPVNIDSKTNNFMDENLITPHQSTPLNKYFPVTPFQTQGNQKLDKIKGKKAIMSSKSISQYIPKIEHFSGFKGSKNNHDENVKSLLNVEQYELSNMKEKIIKMRIIRTLSIIAAQREYSRKIKIETEEKKVLSSVLWQNHRNYKESIWDLEKDLISGSNKLVSLEMSLENIKITIDSSKKSSEQLSQWKEMTKRRIEMFQEQIDTIVMQTDPNVSYLVRNLEESQEELYHLIEDQSLLDPEMIHSVREPIKNKEYVYRSARKLSMQNAIRMKDLELIKTVHPKVEQILQDNFQIRGENKVLKEKIQHLEEIIQQKGIALNQRSEKEEYFEIHSARRNNSNKVIIKPNRSLKLATGKLRFKNNK